MIIRTKRLESTAYHEAGHATMAKLQRIGGVKATIKPDQSASGHTYHNNPLNGVHLDYDRFNLRHRDRMERLVKLCIAGPLAQRKFNPKGFRHYHAEGDYHTAVNLLCYFTGSSEEIEAYYRLLEIQTRQELFLSHNWAIVEAFADELLQQESLTSKEIIYVYKTIRSKVYAKKIQKTGT